MQNTYASVVEMAQLRDGQVSDDWDAPEQRDEMTLTETSFKEHPSMKMT
jgi:hypothetical protein